MFKFQVIHFSYFPLFSGSQTEHENLFFLIRFCGFTCFAKETCHKRSSVVVESFHEFHAFAYEYNEKGRKAA